MKFIEKYKELLLFGLGTVAFGLAFIRKKSATVNLYRLYKDDSTVGNLYVDGEFFCKTLELTYKNNQRSISCIPEGRYELRKFKRSSGVIALEVFVVPNRSAILIHTGTDATPNADGVDTRGCILTNSEVDFKNGVHGGSGSKIATEKFYKQIFPILENGGKVYFNVRNGFGIGI
jgi:Family of unknown function (DUF5675)